ncbi:MULTISPECIES: radical SAM protein [unclassified Desulfovibrio]|uniref:radical SAM protein n=1 Tax=unclassified Desulfovibrio TaxID=2593640 RepID=UPI0013ECCF0E|nr:MULTISPECIES: radical SAM protein [unclassified Desulfovibrio]
MKFAEPVYRPPMEANSLLLPVTQSCNWNKCNFCYRLKDYPFLVTTPDDLEQEILSQRAFYPPNTDIFLVGSNTFVLPVRKFREFFAVIRKYYPQNSSKTGKVSMFSRVDAIADKSDADLTELRELGVRQLYVGTENGNDDALELMNKGHNAAESLKQLKRLDAAGIDYTVFYIIGMGGKGAGEKSARETAALFNRLKPVRIVSTGMTVTEGTGAAKLQEEGLFVQAPEREKIEELRLFLQELTVDTFYDGIHYLNPLHYRFQTSDAAAKKKILTDIDAILARYSESELEAAINRRQMEEDCKPAQPQN